MPKHTHATDNNKQSSNQLARPVWEQHATDQSDPWLVVAPRQVFTPYDCLLISVMFVVLCNVCFVF